jgi:hypothetical protein
MVAHIGQPTPSRRFIQAYLGTWGLLAVGALGYLAMLAFPPQAGLPPQATAVPPPAVQEPKPMAEVNGSLSEIRKDVTQLQEAVGERVVNEKVAQTRIAALEDRVGPPAVDGSDKVVKAEDSPGKAAAEGPAPSVAKPPFVPIETGSIGAKEKEEAREEIVFGAPVVTRAGQEFAVQVAAAASINTLRQSWGQLTERHAGALAKLQPRVVAPRTDGGIYRLLAGPFTSKADAERICSELRVGPKACFATPYVGTPL